MTDHEPPASPVVPICEAEWEFDVSFDVMCSRQPGHIGDHLGIIEGNGGVLARIHWDSLPNCFRDGHEWSPIPNAGQFARCLKCEVVRDSRDPAWRNA